MNNPSEPNWAASDEKCLLLFTSRNIEKMVREGGSQAWVLNLQRARECRYVVCAWNPRGEYAQPYVNLRHGEAFLIAPITAIEPAEEPEPEGRFVVRFSDYAVPPLRKVVWTGKRNPVYYTTLSALGLDVGALKFAPPSDPTTAAKATVAPATSARRSAVTAEVPLTIAAAKRGLALQYGIKPEAVEIIIRG